MDFSDTAGLADGEMTAAEAFVDEYYWLRSFGMSDAAIARTLRVSEAGLVKRLQRAGARRTELSSDADIDGRLRALIASGEPFDSWDFPFALEPFQVAAAISAAVRRGLVVRVGDRSVRCGGRRSGLFQETNAAAAHAAAVNPGAVAHAKAVLALVRAVAS